MGRRSFVGLLNRVARETARAQRLAEAEQRRLIQTQLRAARAEERQRSLEYRESRIAEAQDATQELADRVEELAGILDHTLAVDDTLNFQALKAKDEFPSFQPSSGDAFLPYIKPPGFLGKVIPLLRTRYERALQAAVDEYEKKKAEHDAKAAARNQEIEEFKESYFAGDPKAIVGYCSMVLERSDYPDGFPHEFRAAYVPESKQLVIDYELPPSTVVPNVVEHRYVKAKDEIQQKPKKLTEIRKLYQDIVAATTLRTCHELLESDQAGHLDVIVFNGFVQTIDPATGKDVRPCLVSLRVTRERFTEIDLSRIDKTVCLRNLGAQVSPQPYEIQPVKPLVDFDMVDKRFVEQSDVLSDLESRSNLMDLNPFEFENFVGNLFKQLGLETKLTRSSRDGGVDVVAFDVRPVLGGKVVIQAKRYKNTVGVSAVRDLFGTMMNEGANKGILVTTSGYGPDAFDFAKDKPIELIDGGQLLYLLDQCGVKARIVFPEDWKGD